MSWFYKHNKLSALFAVALMYVVTSFFYIFFKPLFDEIRNGVIPQIVTVCLLGVLLIVTVMLYMFRKLTYERVINVIIIFAFLVRLCYMLNTDVFLRQHDVERELYNHGHYAYAATIYSTGKLPVTNEYQFYHPPLNAAIQALFMHINQPLLQIGNAIHGAGTFDISDTRVLFGSCQILSVIYIMITSIFGALIVEELNLSKRAKLFAIAFVVLFPHLTVLAPQVNNDAICIMFSFIAIYLAIKWWKNKSWLSICLCGLSIGLAMNSKISGATICLSIAVIFIWEFVKDILSKDKNRILKTVFQFLVFIVICAPIGLWFPVYAKVRFDQGLGFVFANLNPALSTADHNFFERFINIFDFGDMTKNLWCEPFENYNLFGYLIKCAVAGEYSYWQGEGLAATGIILNYIFVLLMIGLIVTYFIVVKNKNLQRNLFVASIIVFQFACMIYFNIKMPYGCTMDFRYIVPIILGFGGFIALMFDEFKEHKILNVFSTVAAILSLGMVTSSSLFFVFCI